jgi:phenylalanyl-tRNA synthetase alpha chain
MTTPSLKRVHFPLASGAQEALRALEARNDRTARTIKRLFALPDLTRTDNSPVKIVVDEILNLARFRTFDLIEIPEVVSVRENFDLLNTPSDHTARSASDTYYLSGDPRDGWLLRTQTTTMWPFYLASSDVRARLQEQGVISAVCHGRVFRNDEVDRTHYPCFHQIDGLHIVHKRHGVIQKQDLIDVLVGIARSVYGADVETQVSEDRFPFTDPSVELAVKLGGRWLEILGAGCVHPQVLRNFNLDPSEYSGWAFGFGIDRLAMVKMEIPDIRVLWSEDPRIKAQFTNLDSRYEPVSNYPSTFRDITFVIPKSLSLNRFFEVVREEGIVSGEDAIEEVTLVDQYENDAKFGADNKSYSFRIVYRSNARTLTNTEVNETQERIRSAVERELGATLR